MLQKNIDKAERKSKRKTWVGLYTRKTPTKKELLERTKNKHKRGNEND